MKTIDLCIAREFSAYPAGREASDGEYNARRFMNELLVPRLRQAIQTDAKLEVNLEGLLACGSSFLDGSFGQIMRERIFSPKEVEGHIDIVAASPRYRRYIDAAKRYMQDAEKHASS